MEKTKAVSPSWVQCEHCEESEIVCQECSVDLNPDDDIVCCEDERHYHQACFDKAIADGKIDEDGEELVKYCDDCGFMLADCECECEICGLPIHDCVCEENDKIVEEDEDEQ